MTIPPPLSDRAPRRLRARGPLQCVLACALVVAGCAAPRPGAKASPFASSRGDEPLEAEALLRAGERLARRGESVRAEHYLLAALDRGARQDRVLPRLVAVCLHGGRLRAALDHATPYLRRYPGDADLRFLVAAIYLGLGRPMAARAELETVIRMRPRHLGSRYVLGSVLARQLAEPAVATEHFERYLELDPEGPHAPEIRTWLREHARSAASPHAGRENRPEEPPRSDDDPAIAKDPA